MRVLYIEDESDIQMIAKIAMENVGGFEVFEFSSGLEAIEAVKNGLTADVIVVDMMMPGFNGHQTLKELRKITSTARTPAIFMTAKVQTSEIQEYIALGAAGCIPKPFDPMALSDQITGIVKSQPKI